MIKIGDKVKVTGIDGIYTMYQEMADLMGSKLFKKNLYSEAMEFEVVEKHKHLEMNEMVYLLKNDEGEFLFTDKHSDIEVITKPRTKVEYEKVTESIFDLKEEFERGELYYRSNSKVIPPYEYEKIKTIYVLCNCAAYSNPNLYRRIETPINERDEFIDAVEKISEDVASEYCDW